MEFLNWKNIFVVFLIWGLIFSLLSLWQVEQEENIYRNLRGLKRFTTQPPSPPLKTFVFDEPTEEELEEIEAEEFDENIITVPLEKPLRVFQCPKEDCKVIGEFDPGTELRFDLDVVDPESIWLPVPWPDPYLGPSTGYILLTDLEVAAQEAPPLPEVGLDIEDAEFEPADPIDINPQTIVGILCEFYDADAKETKITKGSGALVSEEGHIITARSVVDLNYLNEGLEDFVLKSCLIGQIPSSEPLPSIESTRRVNAFVRVPLLPYMAEVFYIPNEKGLSDYEKSWLDFSIIQITKLNPDASYFGITALPEKFPFAPILISDLPKINEDILSFGFPSGTTIGLKADVRTLFMQGLLNHITNYWAGDKRYDEDLFIIEAHLDTEDTAGGRFGSPIFWKGYIIGVHTVKQRESLQTFNVSAKAVLENLFDNNVIVPFEIY